MACLQVLLIRPACAVGSGNSPDAAVTALTPRRQRSHGWHVTRAWRGWFPSLRLCLWRAETFPAPAAGLRGTFLSLRWGGGWQGGDKPSSPSPQAAVSVDLPPKAWILLLLRRHVGGPRGAGCS